MNTQTEQVFLLNSTESQPSTASPDVDEAAVASQDGNDFSRVCRTCAAVTEYVVPIFHAEGLQNNLAEKIHKHLPIQVSETDVLPRVVCYQCASTLLAWHELVQCCVQADAALRTRLAVAAAKASSSRTVDINEPGSSSATVPNTDQEQNKQNKGSTPTDSNTETESEQPVNKLPDEGMEKPSLLIFDDGGKRYRSCEVCKKIVNVNTWNRHVRSHRGEKRHSCDTCGLVFSESSNLARHTRALHNNQRPYSCGTCQKTFFRKEHLEDHLKSHSKSRDYICDFCGKASKSSAALRMHRKSHDTCRFQCMECGARFKRRGELTAHVTVHTGEKAFACFCGKSFRLRIQLNAHARMHETIANTFREIADFVVQSLEPPQYVAPAPAGRTCAYCSTELSEDAYKEHLVAAHSDYLFQCDECDTYVDRKDFILHMSLHAVEYAAKQDKRAEAPKRVKKVKRKPEAKDENENDQTSARKYPKRAKNDSNGNVDLRSSDSESDPEENDFSDHSDAEYGFAPLPESVFEAIEDTQDSQPTNEAEAGSSHTGDAEAAEDQIDDDTSVDSLVIDTPPEPAESIPTDHTPEPNDDIPTNHAPPQIESIPTDRAPAPLDITPIVQTAQPTDTTSIPGEQAPAPKKRNRKGSLEPRTCPLCGKVYKAASSYFYHMKHFHKRTREHECVVCRKKFGTKACLVEHKTIHTGECQYACRSCPKRFRSKASRYIHEQTHNGVKMWSCSECHRSFRWRTHLARHMRRHAAAKEYVCETCGRGFSVRCDMLRHVRTHEAGDHICPNCGLKFAQLRYMKVHIDRKHGVNGERPPVNGESAVNGKNTTANGKISAAKGEKLATDGENPTVNGEKSTGSDETPVVNGEDKGEM